MYKRTYINTLPYEYTDNPMSHYLINGSTHHKNHGELMESIAKYNRGLYTSDKNPNTSFDKGSDIPEIAASVKSSDCSLARIHFDTATKCLKYYFKHVPSKIWIWVEFDEKTGIVTEYIMNKSEFGAFAQKFSYLHYESGTRAPKMRFRKTSKKMIAWLEMMCARSAQMAA